MSSNNVMDKAMDRKAIATPPARVRNSKATKEPINLTDDVTEQTTVVADVIGRTWWGAVVIYAPTQCPTDAYVMDTMLNGQSITVAVHDDDTLIVYESW